jgi:hypothetical protein
MHNAPDPRLLRLMQQLDAEHHARHRRAQGEGAEITVARLMAERHAAKQAATLRS